MIKWRTDEPPRAKEVLVTWENLYPAPGYDFIKGKRFVDEQYGEVHIGTGLIVQSLTTLQSTEN
jgi:hypothetical protein